MYVHMYITNNQHTTNNMYLYLYYYYYRHHTMLFMYGFCHHFNNLRFNKSQSINDFSAAHAVI